MKIKDRKQWLSLYSLACDEGFQGKASDFDDVLSYIADDLLIKTVSVGGQTVEVKALSVELSEDQTQALVTEGGGQPPAQQQQQPNPPPQQNQLSAELIAAAVQKELKAQGYDLAKGRRPQSPDGSVKMIGPSDEVIYNARAKRGMTRFSNGATAKAFDAMIKSKVARYWRKDDIAKGHDALLLKVAEHHGISTKAMATSPDSAGGALTEELFMPEIIRNIEEYGVMTRLVGFREMPELQVTYKRRTGGITIYHPNENSAITESSPTYDNVNLTSKTALALTLVSNQLLKYATPDAGDEAAFEISYAFAKYIDDSVLGGDGSGGPAGLGVTLPNRVGFYNSYGSTASDGGYIVVGGDTTAAHTDAQLSSLLGRLPVYASKGGVIVGSLNKIEATFGRLARSQGGVTMGEYTGFGPVRMYAGIPIIPHFSDINGTEIAGGTPADQIDFLYGNFERACKIHRTGGLEIEVSADRYFDTYSTAVRGAMNWDFNIHDIGDGTNPGNVVSFWQT